VKFTKNILQKLSNSLIYLIVFLLPSQFGLHIWPSYSFVYGLRIDYLAITIYLTDLLIIAYVLITFLKRRDTKLFNKSNLINVSLLLLFALVNTLSASIWELSFIKWLKIFELLFFSLMISKDNNINLRKVITTFFLSVIFFGSIGLMQVIKGGTLNGLFYYFGERTFTMSTPGTSLITFFNNLLLRPYSTFSHPNSMAGYLLLVYLFTNLFNKVTNNKIEKLLNLISNLIIFLLLILCYSKSSFIAIICLILIFVLKIYKNKKIIYLIPLKIYILSILSPVIYSLLKFDLKVLPSTISERLVLSNIAGEVLSKHPLFGLGLNNFISNIIYSKALRVPFWFLQPVHNIYLLTAAETGLIGLGISFYFVIKYLNYLIQNNKFAYVLIIIAILVTGLFDHYWLTLQQNILLVSLFLGLSLNKNIS